MKIRIFIYFFLVAGSIKGQKINNIKIDTSNYFKFLSNGVGLKGQHLTMDWLRLNDILPIIKQEMKSAGYDPVYTNYPIKVAPSHSLKLTVYSAKLKAGFLYIEGHELFPSRKYRKDMTQKSFFGVEYRDLEKLPGKEEELYEIKKLPENVFPLNENNYWFQYTTNSSDSKKLINRQIAISILRQDIKAYLTKQKVNHFK